MKLLAINSTLMISAAAKSSLFVLRMRPRGFASVSFASPLTSGITATPVSNPESPSASFGKTNKPTSMIMVQLPPTRGCPSKAFCQFEITEGFCATWYKPTPRTTTLSRR